jgi:hypothetical protein
MSETDDKRINVTVSEKALTRAMVAMGLEKERVNLTITEVVNEALVRMGNSCPNLDERRKGAKK